MYKPLPDGITIKYSKIQGLGLYATKDFPKDTWYLELCILKIKTFHTVI